VRRRLDAELVRRGLVDSRRRAAEAIDAGRVVVGGAPVLTAARLVRPDDAIALVGEPPRFVSRGGEKLDAALDHFAVDVSGQRVLDAGASTGGFTDCVLQRGAAQVVCVDVGRGQLAWSVRTDERVIVLERTNVRTLEADAIGGPVDMCVADLSFISLRVVAPALVRCCRRDADALLLVKPQFEAGRGKVGRGGVVRDPAVHRDVLTDVASALAGAGLAMIGVMNSPLRGADGNIEFVAHCRAGATENRIDAAMVDSVVAAAHGGGV